MLVLALVELAREQEYEEICALTLRSSFFERLGFEVVDRWRISPKVWQACIYCAKFHHCDEVAVLMPLVDKPVKVRQRPKPRLEWSFALGFVATAQVGLSTAARSQ